MYTVPEYIEVTINENGIEMETNTNPVYEEIELETSVFRATQPPVEYWNGVVS